MTKSICERSAFFKARVKERSFVVSMMWRLWETPMEKVFQFKKMERVGEGCRRSITRMMCSELRWVNGWKDMSRGYGCYGWGRERSCTERNRSW